MPDHFPISTCYVLERSKCGMSRNSDPFPRGACLVYFKCIFKAYSKRAQQHLRAYTNAGLYPDPGHPALSQFPGWQGLLQRYAPALQSAPLPWQQLPLGSVRAVKSLDQLRGEVAAQPHLWCSGTGERGGLVHFKQWRDTAPGFIMYTYVCGGAVIDDTIERNNEHSMFFLSSK